MKKAGKKQLVITKEFWKEPLGSARENIEKRMMDEAEEIAEREGMRIHKFSDISWKPMYGMWIARLQAAWGCAK